MAANVLSELHIPDRSAALATMTLLLQSVLDNYVKRDIDAALGDVIVTASPPDRITTGGDERSQINLFLYRVSPNVSLKSKTKSGHFETQFAVELSYLITAYGSVDLHAEVLLGRALWVLNQIRVESLISEFTGILNSGNVKSEKPKAFLTSESLQATLTKATVIESLQDAIIKPQFIGFEEMSKLWSSLQCKYRPSFTFLVAPVQL